MATITSRVSAGRIILTVVALFTAISPFVFDWNSSHIYNPAWPTHTKFHNAQTMSLGALLGLTTLYCIWLRTTISQRQSLNEAVCAVSLYWVSQLTSILFPGTALFDSSDNHLNPPMILGLVELNQITMDFFIILPLIVLGFTLEVKRLSRTSSNY